jgi:hypothetical protein
MLQQQEKQPEGGASLQPRFGQSGKIAGGDRKLCHLMGNMADFLSALCQSAACGRERLARPLLLPNSRHQSIGLEPSLFDARQAPRKPPPPPRSCSCHHATSVIPPAKFVSRGEIRMGRVGSAKRSK